jgi:hypothetical protein
MHHPLHRGGLLREVIAIVQHVYSQQDVCNSKRKRIDKGASKAEAEAERTDEKAFPNRMQQFEEEDRESFSAQHSHCAPVGSV